MPGKDLPADLAPGVLYFTECTFAYVAPARIAMMTLARSPAARSWAGMAITFAAVIVPWTIPVRTGHAGLPPPPHKKIVTPPLVAGRPKWIWAAPTSVSKP